jgi:hypothetical protein
MNSQIDRRREFVIREMRSYGKRHCRVDQRRRHSPMKNSTRLAKVVAHFHLDDRLVRANVDEPHPDQLCERQAVKRVCRSLFSLVRYVVFSVVHLFRA